MATDFPGAFAALREVLKRQSAGMVVQADTPTDFVVITAATGPNKKPLWFGAVMQKKSAVTYHLFPLYYNPKLQAEVSPELSKRKQGKTCFNFQRPDPELFAQLDRITQLGRAGYERHGFLQAGLITAERFNAALKDAGEDPEAIARTRASKAKAASAKRATTIRKKARTL